MPFSSSSEPALPAAWTDVLDRIQCVLADALSAAAARAQALESAPFEGVGEARRPSEGELSPGPASVTTLECAKHVAETERILAAAQEALNRWLATSVQVGQRLAEQAGRAV